MADQPAFPSAVEAEGLTWTRLGVSENDTHWLVFYRAGKTRFCPSKVLQLAKDLAPAFSAEDLAAFVARELPFKAEQREAG